MIAYFPQRSWLLHSCLAPTSPEVPTDGEAAAMCSGDGSGHRPMGLQGLLGKTLAGATPVPLGVLTPGSICHQQSLPGAEGLGSEPSGGTRIKRGGVLMVRSRPRWRQRLTLAQGCTAVAAGPSLAYSTVL